MLRIAVCDDQEIVREDMSERIGKESLKEKCVIDTFEAGEDVLEAMRRNCYDIYFLDIELMEGRMDGYELAGEIRKRDRAAVLIFLSGHDEYACEAFEVGVLSFLRKPVVEEKFHEAFWKAMDIVLKGRETFSYTVRYQEKQILLKKIIYFESNKRKIILHKDTGEKEIFYGSLKNIQKSILEKNFVLCHSSYLVNLEYIKEVDIEQIILTNGKKLPVSRRYKSAVKCGFVEYRIMVNREER